MDEVDGAARFKLDAFLQSVRDSREETSRHGLAAPEDVERRAAEAIARGLRRREREGRAGRAKRR